MGWIPPILAERNWRCTARRAPRRAAPGLVINYAGCESLQFPAEMHLQYRVFLPRPMSWGPGWLGAGFSCRSSVLPWGRVGPPRFEAVRRKLAPSKWKDGLRGRRHRADTGSRCKTPSGSVPLAADLTTFDGPTTPLRPRARRALSFFQRVDRRLDLGLQASRGFTTPKSIFPDNSRTTDLRARTRGRASRGRSIGEPRGPRRDAKYFSSRPR